MNLNPQLASYERSFNKRCHSLNMFIYQSVFAGVIPSRFRGLEANLRVWLSNLPRYLTSWWSQHNTDHISDTLRHTLLSQPLGWLPLWRSVREPRGHPHGGNGEAHWESQHVRLSDVWVSHHQAGNTTSSDSNCYSYHLQINNAQAKNVKYLAHSYSVLFSNKYYNINICINITIWWPTLMDSDQRHRGYYSPIQLLVTSFCSHI